MAAVTIALAWMALAAARRADAAYPGTNGQIVFQSDRDTAAGDLYAITPGGAPQRLTTSTGSSDPVYSPDGTKIAFVSANPGGAYQIFVANADGSGRTPVTSGSSAKQQPTWSPDGNRIAFVANSFDVDGQTDLEIWSMNVDGSGLTQVTSNASPDTYPAWSPLGDKIAFVSARPGDTDRNIYVMNTDGTGQTSITPNSLTPCAPNCYEGNDDDPAWAPDGSRIAYVHGRGPSGGGTPDIWTAGPDGSNRANLSNNDSVAFTQPAWAPQGDQIAAVGAVTTDRDIWVMAADGSGQRAIETHTAHDINPDWGPLPAAGPSNAFTFGQPKLNEKKGTAKLPVTVPGPGTLALSGKNVVAQRRHRSAAERPVTGPGTVNLLVKPRGKAKRRLGRIGKVKVKVTITFTPTGGSPASRQAAVKLRKELGGR
jgi:TolB protein